MTRDKNMSEAKSTGALYYNQATIWLTNMSNMCSSNRLNLDGGWVWMTGLFVLRTPRWFHRLISVPFLVFSPFLYVIGKPVVSFHAFLKVTVLYCFDFFGLLFTTTTLHLICMKLADGCFILTSMSMRIMILKLCGSLRQYVKYAHLFYHRYL